MKKEEKRSEGRGKEKGAKRKSAKTAFNRIRKSPVDCIAKAGR